MNRPIKSGPNTQGKVPRRFVIDPRPGAYYVSVRDGRSVGLIAGPFRRHKQALAFVNLVRAYVIEHYPFSVFYAFGTARRPDNLPRFAGTLNDELGIVPYWEIRHR